MEYGDDEDDDDDPDEPLTTRSWQCIRLQNLLIWQQNVNLCL